MSSEDFAINLDEHLQYEETEQNDTIHDVVRNQQLHIRSIDETLSKAEKVLEPPSPNARSSISLSLTTTISTTGDISERNSSILNKMSPLLSHTSLSSVKNKFNMTVESNQEETMSERYNQKSGIKRKRTEAKQTTLKSWVQKLRNREFKAVAVKKQKTNLKNEQLESNASGKALEDSQLSISSFSSTSSLEEISPHSSKPLDIIELDAVGDQWNSDYVRLPCSPHNLYKASKIDKATPKWNIICDVLKQPLNSPLDIEEAILTMNPTFCSKWNFDSLIDILTHAVDRDTYNKFFQRTLPRMQLLALELPNLISKPIRLLRKLDNKTVKLTQAQIACLMSHAFLCTYPRRNSTHFPSDEYFTFPYINFNSLYRKSSKSRRRGIQSDTRPSVTAEKLKILLHYFDIVTFEYYDTELRKKYSNGEIINPNERVVVFERRSLMRNEIPDWGKSTDLLCGMEIVEDGSIEDCKSASHLDFANKKIGGGVIGRGCVQEEIRFLINTECIISRLFVEEFAERDCLIIRNSRRFASYSGYSESFKFKNPYKDDFSHTPNEIICIDALNFSNNIDEQYRVYRIRRELNKAYCGFASSPRIAIGNWGGGVFQGDRQLKAIIQLMAGSQAKCDSLLYHAYGDKQLAKELVSLIKVFKATEMKVGELYKILLSFSMKKFSSATDEGDSDLFSYILQSFY